jgi:hypothetical protein
MIVWYATSRAMRSVSRKYTASNRGLRTSLRNASSPGRSSPADGKLRGSERSRSDRNVSRPLRRGSKRTDSRRGAPFYHKREVWWCTLGVNVGSEENGSGEEYRRPALILKGLSVETCLIVSLTTSGKDHPSRVAVGLIGGKQARVEPKPINLSVCCAGPGRPSSSWLPCMPERRHSQTTLALNIRIVRGPAR